MNDGGPAFPFVPNQQMKLDDGTWDQHTDFGESGMTLRQHYACEAMKSFLEPRDVRDEEIPPGFTQLIRTWAFAMADEMLREEPPTDGSAKAEQ